MAELALDASRRVGGITRSPSLSVRRGDDEAFLRRWTSASSTTVDVLTNGGRFGGGAIRIRNLSSEETLTKNLTAPYPATLILGAAVLIQPENTAGKPGEDEILQLLDSTNTVQVTVTWSSQDQLLRAYREGPARCSPPRPSRSPATSGRSSR